MPGTVPKQMRFEAHAMQHQNQGANRSNQRSRGKHEAGLDHSNNAESSPLERSNRSRESPRLESLERDQLTTGVNVQSPKQKSPKQKLSRSGATTTKLESRQARVYQIQRSRKDNQMADQSCAHLSTVGAWCKAQPGKRCTVEASVTRCELHLPNLNLRNAQRVSIARAAARTPSPVTPRRAL